MQNLTYSLNLLRVRVVCIFESVKVVIFENILKSGLAPSNPKKQSGVLGYDPPPPLRSCKCHVGQSKLTLFNNGRPVIPLADQQKAPAC